MYCVKKIEDDTWWVGGNDRRLALFENVFPIPDGVSYNSYLILDEKTVLLDTVDKAVSEVFFENLEHLLAGRSLDYLIVNHMEPDHAATLAQVALRWPGVQLVGSAKTLAMIGQFFALDLSGRFMTVKEGDTLTTGRHSFAFVMAPMVHWPEVMVTFDTATGTLYSADAFGTFGALAGSLFADELDFEHRWLDDARRYYVNIVGKYGASTTALLQKAAGLDIRRICPLHGPVWRQNLGWFVEKYRLWGSYQPEDRSVVIACGSIYGNTENAAEILAGMLADRGVQNIRLYDVSATHPSYLVSEAFRASHLVLAGATYNSGVFCNMETLLHDLAAHNFQNRTMAVIENGSWAPQAAKQMRAILEPCKNLTWLEPMVSLRSSCKAENRAALEQLADSIAASL